MSALSSLLQSWGVEEPGLGGMCCQDSLTPARLQLAAGVFAPAPGSLVPLPLLVFRL